MYRQRPRRVALLGARVQLAQTLTDVVDVSETGVRIRVSYELRTGSEWPWPRVLELPSVAPVQVIGPVVRCDPVAVSLPVGRSLNVGALPARTLHCSAGRRRRPRRDPVIGSTRRVQPRVVSR